MTQTTEFCITSRQKEQYREEGYFILEGAIPQHHLQDLRDECQRFIDLKNVEMDRRGVDVDGITHRNSRYFISQCAHDSPKLQDFLFSARMAEICRATIGDEAYLFNEQFVVKCAEKGMKFAWHQDSGYIGHEHRPYLSCWCALDEVTEDNGTVYILPYSHAGSRAVIQHRQEQGSNDLVGYHGDDPGIPVVCSAGSIAVFSSTTFHRSGVNTTSQIRRIYLAQYSPEPILTKDGSKLWGWADPFLKSSKCVTR